MENIPESCKMMINIEVLLDFKLSSHVSKNVLQFIQTKIILKNNYPRQHSTKINHFIEKDCHYISNR